MKVNTCCGCGSLQTGTTIIGILGIVGALIGLIKNSIDLSALSGIDPDQTGNAIAYHLTKTMAVAYLGTAIVGLILSGLLIVGSVQRLKRYLFPFVCIGFSQIIMGFVYFLAVLVFFTSIPDFPGAYILGFVIAFGLTMALFIYMWLVVYSFHQELAKEEIGDMPTQMSKKGYVIPPTQNV